MTSTSGARGGAGDRLSDRKLCDRNARANHSRQQGGRDRDGNQRRAWEKVAEPAVVGPAIERVQGAEEKSLLLLRRMQLSQIETIRTE